MAPPILTLRNAAINWGSAYLFQGIDLTIGRQDRLCLLGRNGSGKSTLLKTLAGQWGLDHGELYLQPGLKISYLPQEPHVDGSPTVGAYISSGLGLEHTEDFYKVEAIADELHLDINQVVETLSGGEMRRASLARVFVSEANLLLLDEPTNHLDLPTIEWLEKKLTSFRGAFIVISHDRKFLANLSSACLWLERTEMRRLNKGFSHFDAWAEELSAQQELERHKLDKLIALETEWSHKGITARRKRNQGRLRQLAKLRVERANQIDQVGGVALNAESGALSGKLVIEASNVTKSYGTKSKPIIDKFSYRIVRGDRIGIIGANGAGKTTLLNLLMGALPPDTGSIRLGTNLTILTLDQKRESLDPQKTLWETLSDGGDHVTVMGKSRHIVSYLKDYLFSEEQARQPVNSLSGGERNRLMLARAFTKPSNLIVLDEPTNDLDMETLELLQEMLSNYDGTLIMVSHDRDFIDRVVTSTIALEGDGQAISYPGGYSDYLEQRKSVEKEKLSSRKRGHVAVPNPSTLATNQKSKKLSYKYERRSAELVSLIPAIENKIALIETNLSDNGSYNSAPGKFAQLAKDLEELKSELALAEEEWLEIELSWDGSP